MNALAAFSDTYNVLEGMAQDRAKRQAGNALAQGDYQGASGTLLGRGMLDEGMGVQRYQQGQQDRQAEQQRQLSEQEKAAAGERVQFLMRATKTLRGVPADQRATVLQSQIIPAMANLPGFDPEILRQLGSADLSDETLDVFGQSLGVEADKYQLFNTAGGIVGVQGGQARMIYEAPDEPDQAPNGYRWRPDGALEAIPGGPADPRVAGARAAATRAPARPRAGGGSSPAAKLPSGFILDGN
jgi:hypothetical protein